MSDHKRMMDALKGIKAPKSAPKQKVAPNRAKITVLPAGKRTVTKSRGIPKALPGCCWGCTTAKVSSDCAIHDTGPAKVTAAMEKEAMRLGMPLNPERFPDIGAYDPRNRDDLVYGVPNLVIRELYPITDLVTLAGKATKSIVWAGR